MKTSEIIDGLEDLIQDRESFATPANDKFYGKDNPFRYDIEVLQAAIDKLRRTEPENKALTVEQLRKMDGKLVWAVCRNINAPPCLMRVQNFNNRCATDDKEYYELFADYGKTWLAYVRKPEGSEEDE